MDYKTNVSPSGLPIARPESGGGEVYRNSRKMAEEDDSETFTNRGARCKEEGARLWRTGPPHTHATHTSTHPHRPAGSSL